MDTEQSELCMNEIVEFHNGLKMGTNKVVFTSIKSMEK